MLNEKSIEAWKVGAADKDMIDGEVLILSTNIPKCL